ncbi:MAG: methionine--tRNA ligase subunit beta, partial [Lachnospiraceae bacterium]|nr:methionine--tRNA ligase subunit beta [Lachnospiraceae bacterium]
VTKVTETPEILFARLDKEEIAKKAAEVEAKQRAEYVAHQKKAVANLLAAGRISQADADRQLAALGGAAAETGGVEVELKEEITYDDFAKCQFVVGEIVKCEEVPKSKKLLCSQVNVGGRTVQILSGIKAAYTPEQMVGRKVMVLLNLKPAKMAGLESQGMLLCAEDPDGNLALITPDASMPAGSEIC